MSFQDKIKNKFSNSSEDNQYDELKKELSDLKKEFKSYKKTNEKVLDSYNNLFNNLFIDFEIKPKGALKYTQELSVELLDLYANICRKHNLEYWLDFGTLLGAIRHKGFIPWDDDLDVGMMRKDCVMFNHIIDDEITSCGLDDIIKISKLRIINGKKAFPFTQITISTPQAIYSGLDVFPDDFISNPSEDIESRFKKARKKYRDNLLGGMDKQKVIEEYYDYLNCSMDYQDYFLPCIEYNWGTKSLPFKLFESNCVFPLKEIEFCGKFYSAPNDAEKYISMIYGNDFMNIPKVIQRHKRVLNLKNEDNFDNNFKYYLDRLKEVNKDFK